MTNILDTLEKKKNVLKIGELAELVGETVPTIRHWTKEGLLSVAEYTQGGYQLYGQDQVAIIKKIRKLQDKDRLTIAEIKKNLNHNTNPVKYVLQVFHFLPGLLISCQK